MEIVESSLSERLLAFFGRLFWAFGPQGWWPAADDFEMVVGAILTQSTAWVNVERAIGNLRVAGVLSVTGISGLGEGELAALVRPSGYFNGKAAKLKSFVRHLETGHRGALSSLFHVKLPRLRQELPGIWGIGPETADAIILYGARQPVFVVDAYTRRIAARLGVAPADASYEELQRLFTDNLPTSIELFQEYHALLVAFGKEVCRPSPRCFECPLSDLCPTATDRPSPSRPAAPQALD